MEWHEDWMLEEGYAAFPIDRASWKGCQIPLRVTGIAVDAVIRVGFPDACRDPAPHAPSFAG